MGNVSKYIKIVFKSGLKAFSNYLKIHLKYILKDLKNYMVSHFGINDLFTTSYLSKCNKSIFDIVSRFLTNNFKTWCKPHIIIYFITRLRQLKGQ